MLYNGVAWTWKKSIIVYCIDRFVKIVASVVYIIEINILPFPLFFLVLWWWIWNSLWCRISWWVKLGFVILGF